MNALVRLLFRLLPACLLTLSASAALPVVPASASPTESFRGEFYPGESFDLDRHSITFLPDGAGSYRYFVRPIPSLPVDMSRVPGGEPHSVTLAPGRTFPFFGTNHTAFEVNYNGTIDFENDDFGTSDLGGHLATRQIAVLGSDFYSEREAGTYRVLESTDKVTIHFEGLPGGGELENLSSNTFQAELFFDGTIRLSYFGVDAKEGIVGLSNGSGGSPVFYPEEDFSSFQLVPATASTAESGPSVAVTVKLTTTSDTATTFAYSCHDLTAIGGADYTPVAGISTIPAFADTATILVPLFNDLAAEIDESFLLRLSEPGQPGRIYGESEVWILDNDTPHPVAGGSADRSPRIRLVGSRVYVEPGGSGTAAFRVVAVQGGSLMNPVTGTALGAGAVFSLAQGAAGLISTSPNMHFTLEAIDSPAGNRLGVASFVIGAQPPGTLFAFQRQEVMVTEGRMAELVVTATGPGRAVHYEIIPGTATGFDGSGGDYLPKLLPLQFKHGRAVVEIPVFADRLTEGPEYFEVRLVGGKEGDFLSPASWARVTVADGEGPVRLPLDSVAAAPTAVEASYWPGDHNLGLYDYPGLFPPVVSDGAWINIPIAAQSEKFLVSFVMETSSNPIDAVVGLSGLPAAGFQDLSAIVRASPAGVWDAYDNDHYEAESPVNYSAASRYKVWMTVNLLTQRYDVRVAPWSDFGDSEEEDFSFATPILVQGQFRKSNSVLRYLSMKATSGSATVTKVKVHQSGASIPFHPQTGNFSVEFDLKSSSVCDVLIGLSDATGAPETAMSAILKESEGLYGSRKWAAWTGGGYFQSTLAADWLESYHVRFDVNVPAGTYTITLTPRFGDNNGEWGTAPFPLFGQGVQGTFRAPAARLSRLNIVVSPFGDYEITNLRTPPRAVTEPHATQNNSYWINIPIPRQTAKFSLSYDLQTSGSPIDAISGLSASPAYDWVNVSAICRANPSGSWDARHGTVWAATGSLSYSPGIWYRVTMDVDVATNKYDVTVTPEGGLPVRIFSQATFRKSATELNYLTLRSVEGELAVRNIGEPVAHPSDGSKQSVGKIESSLGNGSGVAVADHAVLTSARLVFDEASLSFAPDIDWKHRYHVHRPTGVFLITSYASQGLADNTLGNTAADSLDVAVLAFRPLLVPEHDNAPGLGGYTGFLIDPNPAAGGNPWLTGAGTRVLSFFEGAPSPFGLQGNLQQTPATGLTFTHQGRGVYSCGGLSAVAGTQGGPLFALHSNGRYHPAAICLGNAAGTARFRVVDDAVAHTIYRANLLQEAFDSGENLNLAGVEWRPEAINTTILQSHGVISAALLPGSATWAVFSNESVTNVPLRSSTGGNAVSLLPGSYTVRLYPAAGFSGPSETELDFGVSAGDLIVLPENYYAAAAPSTYQAWLEQHYDARERSLNSVSDPEAVAPWIPLANIAAYAFGIDPGGTSMPNANPGTQTPGLPVITVDRSTSPPTFHIDFLQRIASNATYAVEFNDSLHGTWSNSPVPPTLLPLPGNSVWRHASLTVSPAPSASGRKFARVKVTLNP